MASEAAAKFLKQAKALSSKVEPAGKGAEKSKPSKGSQKDVEDLVTPQASKTTPPFWPKFFKFVGNRLKLLCGQVFIAFKCGIYLYFNIYSG